MSQSALQGTITSFISKTMFNKHQLFLYFIVSVLTVWPGYYFISKCLNLIEVDHSSVWCNYGFDNRLTCKFSNVCYNKDLKSFLFFLTNESVIKGLKSYEQFQKIQLSSVNEHNAFFANISIFEGGINLDSGFIKRGIVLYRFKPDNIMHVIHDDVLPLFLTLEQICLGDFTCFNDFQLLFHDPHLKGPYFEFYEMFSKDSCFLHELKSNVCFKELWMGLNQQSIWYQYGFQHVQGPLNKTGMSQVDMVRFIRFFKESMKLKQETKPNKTSLVMFSRKKNRRLLNEKWVVQTMEKMYHDIKGEELEVMIVDLSVNTTKVILNILQNADYFVGMHGAEMILAMFLKPTAVVIELFPFGIQPLVVSFLKPLTQMSGHEYYSWRCQWKNHSASYPNAEVRYGGINHLPADLQEVILNTEQVPAMPCCDDPNYLYHMYQDTLIGNDFEQVFQRVLQTNERKDPSVISKWFFPMTLQAPTCFFNKTTSVLNITFQRPYNSNSHTLEYNIYIVDMNSDFRQQIVTKETSVIAKVSSSQRENINFHVWISSMFLFNSAKSRDTFFVCT